MFLAKAKLVMIIVVMGLATVITIINYDCTVLTIVNYECKTFIVQGHIHNSS